MIMINKQLYTRSFARFIQKRVPTPPMLVMLYLLLVIINKKDAVFELLFWKSKVNCQSERLYVHIPALFLAYCSPALLKMKIKEAFPIFANIAIFVSTHAELTGLLQLITLPTYPLDEFWIWLFSNINRF